MPLFIPPELKPITAYIRRAEELDNDNSDPSNRAVAFYCRSFAMEKAMNMGNGSDAVNSFLMTLMQDLEAAKASTTRPKEEAKALCEGYAVAIFHSADDGDRGGSEDYREIARTFYNSSTFFDILEQFGPLDEEMSSKRTYSKWKATEIMKALKEGRTPAPGGYEGGDSPRSQSSSSSYPGAGGAGDVSLDAFPPAPAGLDRGLPTLPSSFHMPTQPQYGQQQQQQQPQYGQQHQQQQPQFGQQHQQHQQQQPQFGQQHQQPSHPQQLQPPSHQPSPNYVPPPKTNPQGNLADALELCAFAMAALRRSDTKLGKQRLRDALDLLS